MAVAPFRFLHLDQLALERPLSDIGPVTDALAEKLIQLPMQILENLRKTALDQEVDAVVITGSLFPVAPVSLSLRAAMTELIQRLNNAEIEFILVPDAAEWDSMSQEFRAEFPPGSVLTRKHEHFRCRFQESDSVAFKLISEEMQSQLSQSHTNSDQQGLQIAVVEKQYAGSAIREHFAHVIKMDPQSQTAQLVTVPHHHSAETVPIPIFPLLEVRRQLLVKPESTQEEILAQMQQHLDQLNWDHSHMLGAIHWEARGSGPLLHRLADSERQQELNRQLKSKRPLVHRWGLTPDTTDLKKWAAEDPLAEQFLELLERYQQAGHSDLIADLHSTFSNRSDWATPLRNMTEEISAESVFEEACLQAEHFLTTPSGKEMTS